MTPTVTEEQKQQLQQVTLKNGMNAWDYVQSQSEEDRSWVAAGILSCVEKGYGLTILEINWETRNLRREKGLCRHTRRRMPSGK